MGPGSPVLQLISAGLGNFVNKVVERSECMTKSSESTESVESSEMMESTDSFKTTEISASSTQTQKESANDPKVTSSQEGAQCSVPVTDPELLISDKVTETENPVEADDAVGDLKNSIVSQSCDVSEFCIKMVSTRYCQTGDESLESGVVKSTETTCALESANVMVRYAKLKDTTDPSQRPAFKDAAVQTMEIDEVLPVQPAVGSKDTSPADYANIVSSKTVSSSVFHESDDTFVTADSSGTIASPEGAKIVDSTSGESWSSVQTAPAMVPVVQAETARFDNGEVVGQDCSKVCVEENGKIFSELTAVTIPEQVNDSTSSTVKDIAEANLETHLQITAVELSSTSFTLDDANLPPDDRTTFFNSLRNCYDANAPVITFDEPFIDEPSNPNYGDVSSTNMCDLSTESKGSQNSVTKLLELLEECDLSEFVPETEMSGGLPAQEGQKPVTVMEQSQQVLLNPAVAPLSDSSADGLQLRVLPCNVVVPRLEKKFPQYAHLVRQAMKRKTDQSEDSALKKKFRAEIHDKFPLGPSKSSDSKRVTQPWRPENSERIGNSLSSGLKRPNSKKSKRSRESRQSHEPKSDGSRPKNPQYESSIIFPQGDLTNFRIPKESEKGPIMKFSNTSATDGKRENIPKGSHSSKRKRSNESDDSGTLLCPKNAKVSPKRRDSRSKTDTSLKVTNSKVNTEESKTDNSLKRASSNVNTEVPSSKHQSTAAQPKDSSDIKKALNARKKPGSGRGKENKSTTTAEKSQTEDLRNCDTVVLPGMPELSPWEPSDINVAISQRQTDEKTSESPPVESDKMINVHDLPKILTQVINTYMKSPERRDSVTEEPKRNEPCKGILKNKDCERSSSNRKVTFGVHHKFQIIDCEDELWPAFQCKLPEAHIPNAINGRYLQEVTKAKLLSLKWVHLCHHPESRAIRSPVFDCSEFKCDKSAFEDHARKLVYSHLHEVILETEYRAETTNEIKFAVKMFDTSEKDRWKIVLKRKMDLEETEKFEVGDVVSVKLLTKTRKLSGRWKETIIFGYTEEIDSKMKGDHKIQKMSICVHPIHNEVKRDEAKIQTVVNIGIHLRLLTAVAAIPYSEVVDIYTNSSSIEELKSISLSTESEIIESEQLHAVDLCYDGIQSENPFMYFVDGAPGTGKSHYIVKLIEKLFSKEWPDHSLKVLVVTQSSASADNILQRLVKAPNQGINFNILRYGTEKTIHPTWKKYALSDSNYILQDRNLSFNIDLEERIFAAKKNAIKEYEGSMNDSAADALRKRYVEEIVIGSADVVIMSRDACYTDFLKDFSPCVLVDSHNDHFNRFSVCIFDDANEISEINLLIPVMTMASNLILVGDSRNPTGHDLSLTPFTRLLEKYQKTLPRNTINFKTQYRVHPKVLDCLSKMKLNVDVNQENAESSLALKPLMIVELPSEDESLDHSTHFEAQAKFCKNIVQNIQKVKELKNLDVGVLVGNKHQKEVVHNELKSCSPETFVDKLAAYCGLEKDVIIACIPPLLFPEKFLYTAMTRAKRSVIICGDFAQFQGQETIDELLKNANRRKCFQRWDKDPAEFPFRTMRTSC